MKRKMPSKANEIAFVSQVRVRFVETDPSRNCLAWQLYSVL